MTLDASGRLGIGTTSPTQKLEISGSIQLTNKADAIFFGGSGVDGTWNAPKITRIGSQIIISDYSGVQLGGYDGSNYGPRMTVLGTGNVGIGSSSPIDKLNVSGGATFTGTFSAPTNTSVGSIQIGYDGTNGVIRTWNNSPLILSNYAYQAFETNGSERMRITSGGEVLIGSTGIYGGGSANESDLLVVGAPPSNDVDRGLVSFMDNRAYNTSGLGAKLMLGGSFNSSGSITFFSGLAGLKENTTDGNYAGALAFYTRANGGASTERMRITSGGELLINTTSDAGDYKLQVNGNPALSPADEFVPDCGAIS